MRHQLSGHDAMNDAMTESLIGYKQRHNGRFLRVLLYIIMIWLAIMNIWSMGFKAGTDETLALWPEPLEIERAEISDRTKFETTGTASWYDYKLGNKQWSIDHATAASRDLPRYTHWKVTNLANGKSVVVYINDFGPEAWTGREIDLSSYAFSQIGSLKSGLIEVKIEAYDN